MAMRGNESGNVYELSQNVQNVSYGNVEAKYEVNQRSGYPHDNGRETTSKREASLSTTILLILCLIATVVLTCFTIALFVKDDGMTLKKSFSMLQSLSANLSKKIDEDRFKMTKMEELTKQSLEKFSDLDAKLVKLQANLSNSDNKLRVQLGIVSCAELSGNGVETLRSGVKVYCSDGWAIFQRRMDGSLADFPSKTWNEYAQGFGTMTGELWLGLRSLHRITRQGGCRLRVDLRSFDNDTAYAEYSYFSVASESNLFRVSIGGYSGTAGDSLSFMNGMLFSTNERDNDRWSSNCATYFHTGGWWYNACFDAALNGIYGETRPGGQATRWKTWKGDAAMKFIQMGVRCD